MSDCAPFARPECRSFRQTIIATASPAGSAVSGCGLWIRRNAATTIATAAKMISRPSMPLVQYSALSWP